MENSDGRKRCSTDSQDFILEINAKPTVRNKDVQAALDLKTDTKTDVATTTIQFTNIQINEPIPDARFSIETPPGASVFDMRTREHFEVPAENNK